MSSIGRLGDVSATEHDSHGCPACPHHAIGPAIEGSSDVFVNDRSVLRVGDRGIHASCCGTGEWTAAEGAPNIIVNDRPIHRVGDRTNHCGGPGRLVKGSPDVVANVCS